MIQLTTDGVTLETCDVDVPITEFIPGKTEDFALHIPISNTTKVDFKEKFNVF